MNHTWILSIKRSNNDIGKLNNPVRIQELQIIMRIVNFIVCCLCTGLIMVYFMNNKNDEVTRMVMRTRSHVDNLISSKNLISSTSIVDPRIKQKSTIAIYKDEISWKVNFDICSSTEHFRKATLKSAAGDLLLYVNESPDYVSDNVALLGFFEKNLEGPLYKCLDEDPDLVFLDIGANVGVFSLSAAKKGHRVVSVEVLAGNAARLCRSIKEAGFTENVTLIYNGLSDHKTWMEIVHQKGKEGRVYIRESLKRVENGIYSIYLDDLLEVLNAKRVVMKIDVERHEAKVLEKADTFFKKVDVTCIMMEWERHPGSPDVYQMMVFMARHHMLAYSPANMNKSLDASMFAKWPRNVLWRKVRDYGPDTN